MRSRPWLVVAVAVLAVAAAAVVLADEKDDSLGASARPVQLWAVGDADAPGSEEVARQIRKADPDRVLYLGDVYPTGSARDFRRWAKPFDGLLDRMAPTPGNHDWPKAKRGYFPFWKRVTGRTQPGHYSFRLGGWQILSANSELRRGGATRRWLRRRVRSGGNCRIAFWHRPRFSAGAHPRGGPIADGYWRALGGHARIIVNGHDHNMQRMHARGGVTEFVSGAGGRALYDVDEDDDRLAFSDDTHFGALHLSLVPGEALWEFVSADGHTLASGVLHCRP